MSRHTAGAAARAAAPAALAFGIGLGFGIGPLPASAAILFTPHVDEYARLPRGRYVEANVVHSSIDRIRDRGGSRVPLGGGAIPPGASISATQVLAKALWIGNLFENRGPAFLRDRDQVFRVIGGVGAQDGSGALAEFSGDFRQRADAAGLGDLFVLGGVYGREARVGPVHANNLYTLTVKAPVGTFRADSLLNTGTRYWSLMPQLSHHQDWFGRLRLDATAALQWNLPASRTAYGGLTPSRPASVLNLEANLAWKLTPRLYLEAGFSHYRSLGRNRYDEVTLNLADQPVPPTTACNALRVPDGICSLLDVFHLAPVDGRYRDDGIRQSIATAGFAYVHRASAVFSLRAALPVSGRGAGLTVPYRVCLSSPCTAENEIPGGRQDAELIGVQEAAAVSASPYLEARLVLLLFAP